MAAEVTFARNKSSGFINHISEVANAIQSDCQLEYETLKNPNNKRILSWKAEAHTKADTEFVAKFLAAIGIFLFIWLFKLTVKRR